jgi:CheY-like chemotaxis protein
MEAKMHPWSTTAPDSPGARILIAEDHYDSREALRILLEAVGYRVTVAVDGRAAVDLALADPPDLVLMDVMMPELDGFEATRRLRRNDATRSVPIIVVTAMEGAQRIAAEAGADDFVAKPINTRLLLHKIQELLVRAAAGG